MRRYTINAGVRFDLFDVAIPAQEVAPLQCLPVARSFPAVERVPLYTNVSPRLGLAYDLFGNGKTALKVSVNRYPQYSELSNVDPLLTSFE